MRIVFRAMLLLVLVQAGLCAADPESDRVAFIDYFKQRFPDLPLEQYVNGAYSLDEAAYRQWQEIEEFPPYEFALEEGQILFDTPFANGRGYADCFPQAGEGIRQNYPYFDQTRGEVVTLEYAINLCRETHGETPLPYKKGDIAAISAHLAFSSRGKEFSLKVEGEQAMAAYHAGKQFFYSKRGQLNFSCADCHVKNVGLKLRADQLGPALGQPTHFPVYRSKWGEIGTLQRRIAGCNSQVGAVPLTAQGEEYRNLEYFLSYMSNDLPLNGPGARK